MPALGPSHQGTSKWFSLQGWIEGEVVAGPLPFGRLLEAPACGSPLGVILEAGVPRTPPCTRSPWAPAEVVLPVGTIFKVLVPYLVKFAIDADLRNGVSTVSLVATFIKW